MNCIKVALLCLNSIRTICFYIAQIKKIYRNGRVVSMLVSRAERSRLRYFMQNDITISNRSKLPDMVPVLGVLLLLVFSIECICAFMNMIHANCASTK